MDTFLFDKIIEDVPPFNERICRGLAVEQVKHALDYIRGVMKCACKSARPGLVFEDIVRCTPQEEYFEVTKMRFTKQQIELAKSDVFLVKLLFSFKDDEGVVTQLKPKFIYLPFVTEGGAMRIRGTRYFISPVVADWAISVEKNGIFIPLTRARLNFERKSHGFIANGTVTTGEVVTSRIHNIKNKDTSRGKTSVNCDTSIAHYMFCKFGLTETFKRYAKVDIVVGDSTMSTKQYSPAEWVIVSSVHARNGTRPPAAKRLTVYDQTTLKFAIPKSEYDKNAKLRNFIAAVFYIADHVPQNVLPDEVEDTAMWRLALGKIIMSQRSEGKLANEMDTHIASVSDYVDELARQKLVRVGIHATDIWDLFGCLIFNMSKIMIQTDMSTMYGKNLSILNYLLFDVTYNIFIGIFNLAPDKRVLTADKVDKILTRALTREAVFKINSDSHRESEHQQISSDNMFIKVTSNMVQQTQVDDGFSSSSKELDPQMILHSSQLAIGSHLNQPKSNPTGRDCANPYMILNDLNVTVEPPKHKTVLRKLEQDIRRM